METTNLRLCSAVCMKQMVAVPVNAGERQWKEMQAVLCTSCRSNACNLGILYTTPTQGKFCISCGDI